MCRRNNSREFWFHSEKCIFFPGSFWWSHQDALLQRWRRQANGYWVSSWFFCFHDPNKTWPSSKKSARFENLKQKKTKKESEIRKNKTRNKIDIFVRFNSKRYKFLQCDDVAGWKDGSTTLADSFNPIPVKCVECEQFMFMKPLLVNVFVFVLFCLQTKIVDVTLKIRLLIFEYFCRLCRDWR